MLKSWKTTLAGLITALGVALSQQEDATLKAVGQVLIVVGPIFLGAVSKDNDVTGGTREQ